MYICVCVCVYMYILCMQCSIRTKTSVPHSGSVPSLRYNPTYLVDTSPRSQTGIRVGGEGTYEHQRQHEHEHEHESSDLVGHSVVLDGDLGAAHSTRLEASQSNSGAKTALKVLIFILPYEIPLPISPRPRLAGSDDLICRDRPDIPHTRLMSRYRQTYREKRSTFHRIFHTIPLCISPRTIPRQGDVRPGIAARLFRRLHSHIKTG